jgi:hypothetical protein
MESQTLFNAAISAVSALGGWWLKAMWSAVKDLQATDRLLADKVAAIEVLVAGQYVRKDDFDRLADALFRKLDRIQDKLEEKADK